MKGKIRTLIVDDEPPARRRAQRLLKADPDIDIIGVCANGRDAIAVIQEHNPHLVFLDVKMSPIDGFEVLEAIDKQRMPLVIFVTAHDEYARRAFDVHAIDYLSKPYSNSRFQVAVGKAKRDLRTEPLGEISARTNAFLEERRAQFPERLWVKENECWFPIKTADIHWVEVKDKYVTLHTGEKVYERRQSLSNLETKLNPSHFWRIERRYIVSVACIQEIQGHKRQNAYDVKLRGGKVLTMTRDYRKRLKDLGWDS